MTRRRPRSEAEAFHLEGRSILLAAARATLILIPLTAVLSTLLTLTGTT